MHRYFWIRGKKKKKIVRRQPPPLPLTLTANPIPSRAISFVSLVIVYNCLLMDEWTFAYTKII